MIKARLRIANNVDITRTFSASYRGGVRGYEDMCALETFSNEIAPCVKTLQGFTLIVEPINEQKIKTIS